MRLDQYLHEEEKLTESREKAKALIMAGQVFVNGQPATKPGAPVPAGAKVEVRGDTLPYVSRGGLKLEKALQAFPIGLAGKTCLDAGASTGGFTDCMLQNGAARVYAVDVGYGQLAWKLRSDERVVVMERTNIRHMAAGDIPEPIGFFTVDVSFISLKLVLPAIKQVVAAGAEGVCLVKPQFEAGKEKVGKNGVVRDEAVHLETLLAGSGYAAKNGFATLGADYSPIKGPKGNIEFLLYVKQQDSATPIAPEAARQVCRQAHQYLEDA